MDTLTSSSTTEPKLIKKRKLKSKPFAQGAKTMKLNSGDKVTSEFLECLPKTEEILKQVSMTTEELSEKYPIFKNEELVQKFLNVPLSNNQKGRIRQVLRDQLKGTSDVILADVIHNRILTILKKPVDLNDSDLRKIRVLYNMLKTSAELEKAMEKKQKKGNKKKSNSNKENKHKKVTSKMEVPELVVPLKIEHGDGKEKIESKEKMEQAKKKGPKRYVVFLGNLPLNVNKQLIEKHFSDLSGKIKDIRLPKLKEDRKSAIAYLELTDEPSYQMALSKHHSMLENKRINVLYSAQQKTKMTKAEAKSKTAKLTSLQKQGKLVGAAPAARKRTARRNRAKRAAAAAEKRDN